MRRDPACLTHSHEQGRRRPGQQTLRNQRCRGGLTGAYQKWHDSRTGERDHAVHRSILCNGLIAGLQLLLQSLAFILRLMPLRCGRQSQLIRGFAVQPRLLRLSTRLQADNLLSNISRTTYRHQKTRRAAQAQTHNAEPTPVPPVFGRRAGSLGRLAHHRTEIGPVLYR